MRTLHGLVKWAVETAKFIFDEIFELSERFKTKPVDREALSQTGKQIYSNSGSICDELLTDIKVRSSSTCTLLLLVCSMPRAFLRYSCRVLRGLITQYKAYAGSLSGECLHLFTSINAT